MPNNYSGRRVAFLHHQLALGGSERVSYDAACYLRGLGIESYFFAMHYDIERWRGGQEVSFPIIKLPEVGKNRCFAPANVELIIRTIREEGIDILFVAVPDKVLPTRIKAETQCKLVYWLHSVPYFEAITKIESYRTQGERKWYNRLMWHCVHKPRLLWGHRLIKQWQKAYRAKIECYDAFLVLVEGYRKDLISDLRLSDEEAKRIFVKTNTLHLPEHIPTPEHKPRRIIYMGRLSRSDKRIDRLLRIWHKVMHRLPEWELCIYGSGDKEERYLRQLANSLGLVRCQLMGYAHEPQRAYQEASIICMTSSYEGLPLALLEAQSYGLVSIAFDTSAGIRAIVGESEASGLLIRPFDLDGYAQGLLSLCQDEELYHRLQNQAFKQRLRFAPEVVDTQQWTDILEYLL